LPAEARAAAIAEAELPAGFVAALGMAYRNQDPLRLVWCLLAATRPVYSAAAGGPSVESDDLPQRLLPRLCESCLAEPLELAYFGGTPGGEPRRVADLSRVDFEEAARSGQVLLIENASEGTAMAGWSCERLAQEFPEARMRREYDWVKNPEDRNMQTLGNAAWISKTEAGEDQSERLQQDPQAPPFAPFYWGVREHRNGDIGSRKVVERIRKLIKKSVPAFMDHGNAESLFENAEFWLGAKGTGARAHMDSHCISTLSVVLSGERRWRIGPVPRMPRGAGRSRDDEVVFDDGVAYKLGWTPMFEFTVRKGEAVLFPPGWIHETLNVADGCTVALTTQFDIPRPVRYYRSFYQRLRRVGDLNPCWQTMMSWPSLGEHGKRLPKDPAATRSRAEELYRSRNATLSREQQDFYDLNVDGVVSEAEFVSVFTDWVATEHAVKQERRVRMPRPDMHLGAEAASDGQGSPRRSRPSTEL